jgi:hypothetical protein
MHKKNLPEYEICRLYREGYSTGYLSNKFNCSTWPIFRILNSNEILRRKISEAHKFGPFRNV